MQSALTSVDKDTSAGA